mgnify:CR=1 FL=1
MTPQATLLPPTHGVTELVQTLQKSRVAAGNWQALSKLERAETLLKFAQVWQEHRLDLAAMESEESGFSLDVSLRDSVDWVHRWLQRVVREILANEPKPQILNSTLAAKDVQSAKGVFAVVTGRGFSLRSQWERFAPALMAGNVVIAKPSRHHHRSSALALELWQRSSPIADAIQHLYLGSLAEIEILCQHPTVAAVCFVGSQAVSQTLAQSLRSSTKALSFSAGGRNSAVLLSEALAIDFSQIAETFLTNASSTGYNPQKIYCLEKDFSDWKSVFERWCSSPFSPKDGFPKDSSTSTSTQDQDLKFQFQQKVHQALEEGGKVIGESSEDLHLQKPVVVYDLPYCSEMQTEEYPFPLIILNQVKYQHEFAKWINVSDSGILTCIWGANEKAAKVANQLRTKNIFINTWIGSGESPMTAGSNSAIGESDLSPSSSLWWRRQSWCVQELK